MLNLLDTVTGITQTAAMCECAPETFMGLLTNPAHWLFELSLMVVVDGILVGLCWPRIRRHLEHHDCPEKDEAP